MKYCTSFSIYLSSTMFDHYPCKKLILKQFVHSYVELRTHIGTYRYAHSYLYFAKMHGFPLLILEWRSKKVFCNFHYIMPMNSLQNRNLKRWRNEHGITYCMQKRKVRIEKCKWLFKIHFYCFMVSL